MATHLSVRGLAGEREIEVPEGTTISQIRELSDAIGGGVTIRFNGDAVAEDHVPSDGDVLVTTPPAAKHG